jgi:myosin-15
VKNEDSLLYLDLKVGNLMQQRITRLQTEHAHEISRLIRQYIHIQKYSNPNPNNNANNSQNSPMSAK